MNEVALLIWELTTCHCDLGHSLQLNGNYGRVSDGRVD